MVANDNTSMGLNYRRRVIYHALHDTFPDPQDVRRFFDLWQRDHSHEAHFVVTRFAAVVAKNAGFDAQQRSTFQRRLFHGLTQTYENLPRVPDAWMPATTIEPSAVQAIAASPPVEVAATARMEPPELIVFKTFAQAIATAILAKADRHPGVLMQAVGALAVASAGREQELHRILERWAEARFASAALPKLQSQDDLRPLAHLLYLLAADLLGPMQADRLLAQAASDAERLPEASMFSPQMLL
ncbi:MAG: hypothetical protein HOP03_07920 [Lysobacter sp.]|nr:hypothetical protein [Lysobacter sp.]